MSVAERIGHQMPRICSYPEYHSTSGLEAVELAEAAGLVLDPWQSMVLEHALGEREDGRWSAFEVGLVVSRQNGKGSILEARALAGLFLLGERLIIWSAHEFPTAAEAFRRLLSLIEDNPDFDRRVKRVSRSHGEEGIELHGGQRIRFRTRTKGGGRGFSGDCVILDEAMILPQTAISALMPTLSARPNPQLWYTGSAVDQVTQDSGVVLARIRERGRRGDDPSLAYFEWSLDVGTPDDVDEATAMSDEAWSQANPALGIRISPEYVENEHRSMDARSFAVERLGVGDWPRTDGITDTVIDLDVWDALIDPLSTALDPVWFCIDVTPDRKRASIAAAGRRADGQFHAEIIARREGTKWVAAFARDLRDKHKPKGFLTDQNGPVASLVPELMQEGLEIEPLDGTEHSLACGHLVDIIERGSFHHLGTGELRAAVMGAAKSPSGDSWKWSRKNSQVDISPLVAVTLALWGVGRAAEEQVPMVAYV